MCLSGSPFSCGVLRQALPFTPGSESMTWPLGDKEPDVGISGKRGWLGVSTPIRAHYRLSLARRFDSKCSCSDRVSAVLQMAAFPETLETAPVLRHAAHQNVGDRKQGDNSRSAGEGT